MITWNSAYKTKLIQNFTQGTSDLNPSLSNIFEGRKMPDEDNLNLGEGSYLKVAVLFLDLCGFTDIPSSNFEQQSKLLNTLNLFIPPMLSITKDYGGYYEKNTGDGLMAYFGADDKEDSIKVLSAVNAAITMHYFNKNILTPYLLSKYKDPLRFRIGIDFGYITISKLGIRSNNSFVAIGTTANLACRLLEKGGHGEIIIGNNVKNNLPSYEQVTFCISMGVHEKFFYIHNGAFYPIWKYNAVWKEPIV